jgi:hypothetical protein
MELDEKYDLYLNFQIMLNGFLNSCKDFGIYAHQDLFSIGHNKYMQYLYQTHHVDSTYKGWIYCNPAKQIHDTFTRIVNDGILYDVEVRLNWGIFGHKLETLESDIIQDFIKQVTECAKSYGFVTKYKDIETFIYLMFDLQEVR